jgi:hypothetical protein
VTTNSAESTGSDRIDAERAEDQRVDAKAIFVIFTALVLGAVYFISGWMPDF